MVRGVALSLETWFMNMAGAVDAVPGASLVPALAAYPTDKLFG